MKENTPKYLSELLKNETLKEPLKDSLMLLAMKYDSSYHFFEAIKKEYQKDAEELRKKADENTNLIKLLEQITEKQNSQIRTLEEKLKQFENVQKELNGIREDLQEVKQKEKEMEAEIISLKEQADSQKPTKVRMISEPDTIIKDRFSYDNNMILDKQTRLMWASEDNGKPINWKTAEYWCKNYRGGGYKNWRMPKPEELKELCRHMGKLKKYLKIRHKNLWVAAMCKFISMENSRCFTTGAQYSEAHVLAVRNI